MRLNVYTTETLSTISHVARSLWICVVPFYFTAACTDLETHPIITPTASVIVKTGATPSGHLAPLIERMKRASITLRIGELDGQDPYVFGNPKSIAINAKGEILILDAFASEVRVFNQAGTFLRKVGRSGPGPKEFRAASRVDVFGNSRIVVTSRTAFTIFADSSDVFVPVKRISAHTFPFPEDACVIGDNLIVKGFVSSSPAAIFVIDTLGVQLRAFGDRYGHGGPLTQEDLSPGKVACFQQPRHVVVAYTFLPIVAGYSIEGEQRWQTSIADFKPMVFERSLSGDGRETITRRIDRPGDLVLSLISVSSSAVLLQIAHLEAASKDGKQKIRARDTYVISASDGKGAFVSDRLPQILAVDSAGLWGVATNPTGFLQVVRLSYE